MIDNYPALLHFNRLYWHQTAPDLYGSVDEAFRVYLTDASKLPDGGNSIKRELYNEFVQIALSKDYEEWALSSKHNETAIRRVGGNIILSKTIERLRRILESEWRPRDA